MSATAAAAASAAAKTAASADGETAAAAAANCAAPTAPAAGETVATSTVTLNDGRKLPRVGLGVYQSNPGEETYNAVREALRLGYRHIDSAALYRNENDVGRAVADSGIPREEIWITTKLWAMGGNQPNLGQGAQAAIEAGLASQQRLGTYIDLYLIHSPAWQHERVNAWLGMEELQRRGVVKSIGVSNYGVHHLQELVADKRTTVVPAVNQIELHPFLQQDKIAAACRALGVHVEAYSPIAKARRLQDVPVPRGLNRSPAQVMLRWGLQKGYIVLPKSVNPKRIAQNSELFGWELSPEAMTSLDALHENFNTGWDPTVWA